MKELMDDRNMEVRDFNVLENEERKSRFIGRMEDEEEEMILNNVKPNKKKK